MLLKVHPEVTKQMVSEYNISEADVEMLFRVSDLHTTSLELVHNVVMNTPLVTALQKPHGLHMLVPDHIASMLDIPRTILVPHAEWVYKIQWEDDSDGEEV